VSNSINIVLVPQVDLIRGSSILRLFQDEHEKAKLSKFDFIPAPYLCMVMLVMN
jgi:hypothetical protein